MHLLCLHRSHFVRRASTGNVFAGETFIAKDSEYLEADVQRVK